MSSLLFQTSGFHLMPDPGNRVESPIERMAAEDHWRLLLPGAGGTEAVWRRLARRLGGVSAICDYRLGLEQPEGRCGGEGVVLTLPVEQYGRTIDLLRIALETGRFRRVVGQGEWLGEKALAAAREGAPLVVYSDPLAWLCGWENHAAMARVAAQDAVTAMPANGQNKHEGRSLYEGGDESETGRKAVEPCFHRARLSALGRMAALPGSQGLCVLTPKACDWEDLLDGVSEIEVPDPDFRNWLTRRLGGWRIRDHALD